MRTKLVMAYLRHRQGLFTLALAILRCRSLAEDAVQEAFVRVWEHRAEPVQDPAAYLFATVRNLAISQLRKRRPVSLGTEAADSIYDGRWPDPAQAVADSEQRREACRIVDGLPDEEREVVVLRIYAGLTFAQISAALGQPLSTVANRYGQTLEKIRGQLEHGNGV